MHLTKVVGALQEAEPYLQEFSKFTIVQRGRFSAHKSFSRIGAEGRVSAHGETIQWSPQRRGTYADDAVSVGHV